MYRSRPCDRLTAVLWLLPTVRLVSKGQRDMYRRH